MTPGLAIREATSGDLPGILSVAQDVAWLSHVVPAQGEAPQMARQLELCLEDQARLVLVAQANGDLAGFSVGHLQPYLILPTRECYISELFVGAGHRGRGVGSALLASMEQWAKDNGCYRLMLINGKTRQAYQRGFYAKRGWQERPEVANFVKDLGGGGS